MTVERNAALPQRPYAAPTLIDYGTMAELTRTGTGSLPETKKYYYNKKRRP